MSNNQIMWIRSQENDGIIPALFPINMGWLQVADNEIYFNYFADLDSYFPIGEYCTKERALEVLSEIENHINNGYTQVFHMPRN